MIPERPDLGLDVDILLRRCVECGLCLPHCATYVGTGNEVQSPRGRLALLSHLNSQGGQDAPAAFLEAFDLCIGCRACEAVCPSGVPFQLLERGQELAEQGLPPGGGSLPGMSRGGFLRRQLDSVSFLTFLGQAGSFSRRALSLLLGPDWRKKMETAPGGQMARLLGSMPRVANSDQDLRAFLDRKCQDAIKSNPAGTETRPAILSEPTLVNPRIAFFAGCANAGLMSAASKRLLGLLEASGCQVDTVAGQDCCGALASHTGRPGRASALRRKNQTAFAPYLTEDCLLLVEAAGCGLEFKEKYGEDVAARATDGTVLLARMDLPALGEVPLKVVYHDPCHARHGQGIISEPRQLLERIPGLQLVEPLEPEVCCGSGGAWGLDHPDLSQSLGRRKAADLAATGADLVLTSNPGCLGQIADGLATEAPDLTIMPLTDLLWYAWQKKRPPFSGEPQSS